MNELILLALQQQQGGAKQPSCIDMALPLSLMFLVFYFLMIRPQQKRQREHQEMVNRLSTGDRVVTNGGLLGTVVKVADHDITLEIADRTKVKVVKSQVQLYVAPDAASKDK